MTGVIFKEYLRWFDQQMYGRKVVLLIDGFSAHHSGIDLLLSDYPEGLQYTTILFLPANATSICQPLDQGIIRAWKAHYRKQWLIYVCAEYDKNNDPIKSMTVLQAIRWGMTAWEDGVTATTIQNCWIKSRVLGPKYGPQTEQAARYSGWTDEVLEDTRIYDNALSQIEANIKTLATQQRIKSAMNIAQFLNPKDENVDDIDDDLVDTIAKVYSQGDERIYETDEEDVSEPSIKSNEALQLLKRLQLYEEQQADGDEILISRLNRYERDIRAREVSKQQQASILTYFT